MERIEVEAVYENGVLKLTRTLPLQEGQKVTITIHPVGSAAERLYGIIPWKGSHEELESWLNDLDEGLWGAVTFDDIPSGAVAPRRGATAVTPS